MPFLPNIHTQYKYGDEVPFYAAIEIEERHRCLYKRVPEEQYITPLPYGDIKPEYCIETLLARVDKLSANPFKGQNGSEESNPGDRYIN